MIKITVELIPGGVGEPELLSDVRIWNDLSGNRETGNYKFLLTEYGKTLKTAKTIRGGEIKGFSRLRKKATELLYLALKKVYEK